MAMQTRSLSARGSRSFPSAVTIPYRLATYPSNRSVNAETVNRIVAATE
jgi:hypothetical protein